MKKSELFFAAILVPLDYLMIILAASIAFWLRFTPGIIEIKPVLFDFSFHTYLKAIALVAPFFIIIFAFEGLYSLKSTRTFWREFFKIIFATSVGLTIVILAIFLRREWFSSRFVILSAWLISIVLISGSRYAVNLIQKLLLIYKGIGRHRLVLIGQNGFCDLVKKEYLERPELGYEAIASCAKADPDSLALIHKEKDIDEILVCDPNYSMAELRKVSDFSHRNRIEFKFIPAILQSVSTNFEIKVLFDEPVIEIKNTPLDGWGKIAKRIFDIIGSAVGIIITSPIMLLTALAIKLESPGPAVFRNERIGHKGKFNLFKFRYMRFKYCTGEQNPGHKKALDYEKELAEKQSVRKGPVYKIKNDPRRTRVGRIIEATSIDELPQLFNVFWGDMSLVGPRPHQTREVERYDEWQKRTLSIKPGVTGLAQISGRSDLNFEEEAKLDIYYIESWSLWLDIQILFNTFFVLLKKRNNF
ncbi:MAG: sugar transferase [Parcubacteria group bacterium]|jgi:exopolysaccharide biosynthesis polyprenyl glycosylphosphotransferase